MRYWWVNQNQTYRHEVQGGFLWSPKRKSDGGRNQFYDNMTLVQPGDIVLSFCDAEIKAVGVAQGGARSASKPAFGAVGDQWSDEGWYVPVEFAVVDTPVRPKSFIADLLPHLPEKYAPLQANGNGNQGVYLASITEVFAAVILGKMGLSTTDLGFGQDGDETNNSKDDEAQINTEGRTDIGATQKQQLVLARRGQGVFRANVRLNERRCRITGVADVRFLVASHIKPWRDCSDQEKLDGCNGLLLSPHVDRLFDRGWISFSDDGSVLRSKKLPEEICTGWGLGAASTSTPFGTKQAAYMDYHRMHVFQA